MINRTITCRVTTATCPGLQRCLVEQELSPFKFEPTVYTAIDTILRLPMESFGKVLEVNYYLHAEMKGNLKYEQ